MRKVKICLAKLYCYYMAYLLILSFNVYRKFYIRIIKDLELPR